MKPLIQKSLTSKAIYLSKIYDVTSKIGGTTSIQCSCIEVKNKKKRKKKAHSRK